MDFRQLRTGGDEVYLAQGINTCHQSGRDLADAFRQPQEYPCDLLLLFDRQLFQLIAEVDHDLRLHKQRRAGG